MLSLSKKKEQGYIKQHIVPKSYLNGFASPGKKKDVFIIGVLQKDGKHFPASTEDVGFIKNYYDDEMLDDIKHWEHYYCDEIEGPCSKSIRNVISRVTLSNSIQELITEKERDDLSKFIVTQFTRVPSFINYHIENAKERFIPSFLRGFLYKNGPYLTKAQRDTVNHIELSDSQLKNILMTNITDEMKLKKYSRILSDKIWIVYLNVINDSCPFITSDNPIIMYNTVSNSFSRSDNGIGNQNTIIYVPLNTYVAIGIYPNSFRDTLKDMDSRGIVCDSNDIGFIELMSQCEINQCYNQAFIPLSFYKKTYKEKQKL